MIIAPHRNPNEAHVFAATAANAIESRPPEQDTIISGASTSGTAANRLNDADEAGLIRAKTGSLGDVTSMTGNVSRHNGGALSFAVIVNDPDDSEAAKSAIDTFVAALPKL